MGLNAGSCISDLEKPRQILGNNMLLMITFIYIALFSALELTHCTLITCDSEGVTVAFCSAFFNSHPSSILTVLFGCSMAGAPRHTFCVHQVTMYQFTVSLHLKMHM